MKRVVLVALVLGLVLVAGFAGYRAGLRRASSWAEPYDITIPGTNALSNADRLVVQLDEGKKMTVDLRARPHGRVAIFAGEYPPDPNSPTWHSLVVHPGAANVVRLAVESHKRQGAPNTH